MTQMFGLCINHTGILIQHGEKYASKEHNASALTMFTAAGYGQLRLGTA